MKKRKNSLQFIFVLLALLIFSSCDSSSDLSEKTITDKKEDIVSSNSVDTPSAVVDLFENLQFSFNGLSGSGTMEIDTSLCANEIKSNVEFFIEADVNGKLANGEFIEIKAKYDESFLTENNYQIEKDSLTIEVTNLYRLEAVNEFSEDRAWIFLSDPYGAKTSYWACINEDGNVLFQLEAENNEIASISEYKNGYSYVTHADGVVNVLDNTGSILCTYIPEKDGEVLAYGDGYVFTALNISDFDNNYDLYTIYDAMGNIIYDFSVYIDGKPTNGQVGSVSYCGDGIFGIGIRSAGTWPSWFYCAKTNSLITDIQATTNNKSTDGIMCADIKYHDPDDTGYRGSMLFLTDEGTVSEVPIETDGWNWQSAAQSGVHINENSLLLYWMYNDGEMTRYDIEQNKFVSMDDYYVSKIDWDSFRRNTVFEDGKVALQLKGQDGSPYAAIFDLDWQPIFEPIKCKEMVGYSNNRLVLKQESGYAVYDGTGKMIFELSTDNHVSMLTKVSCYSDGFAIVSGAEEWLMGKRLDTYRYIDEMGEALPINLETDEKKMITHAEMKASFFSLLSDDVISYEEYVSASDGDRVIVDVYVQEKSKWIDNRVTIFADDMGGGYHIWRMRCTPDEYAQLSTGTKIRVVGEKLEWNGETEILDARFEFLDGNYIATPVDVTELLASNEIRRHINRHVILSNLQIEESSDKDGNKHAFLYRYDGSGSEGDVLYFCASYKGEKYTFLIDPELRDRTTDVYRTAQNLNIGDVVNLQGYLVWYDGEILPHVTSIEALN